MTHQEAINRVAAHLATMPRQSQEPDGGTCLYRGPDGLMCAVGALIPDGMLAERQMPYGVLELLDDNDAVRALFEGISPHFLSELQRAHDRDGNWGPDGFEGWTDLASVAFDYDLDLPEGC